MSSDDLPVYWTRRSLLAWAGLAAAAAAGGALAQSAPASAANKQKVPGSTATAPAPIDVAVVLAGYNTLIDFAGPWEILSSSGRFNVYSVAASRNPVICDDGRSLDTRRPISGLTVVPDFTFDDAPQPRIIVVGGQDEGATPAGNAAKARKLDWLRRASSQAELTASVCVGAFVLADAGLLDGHSATTNRNAYDAFQRAYPRVKLVRGVRFVESGPVATATGLTAGIDLALRITQRFCGDAVAEKMAVYEEWPGKDWRV
jgi:transcriptional regulator GlxA family with amidase domain